ncbi:hypothetical protein IEQ34_008690 [Dendrobium chrysotoxum]|uniref:Uncharacterized protein n=1 Tax=Dendrobium chrysotoxum TaxID=161865 RepID=A0AAV7GH58_DENCH|nr:hypothetical protein IEQ34_008690 [Dendrobium chrysotoxum]
MKDDGNILLGLFALTTRESTPVGGHERRRDRLLARSLLLSSTSPSKMAAMKFRSRGSRTRRFLLSKRYLAYCLPIQLTFRKILRSPSSGFIFYGLDEGRLFNLPGMATGELSDDNVNVAGPDDDSNGC